MSVKALLRHLKLAMARRDELSRILIELMGRNNAAANYKCFFTAMNRCRSRWDKRIGGGVRQRRYLDTHRDLIVHMVIRDPVVRLQPFVRGWFIDRGTLFFERLQRREMSTFACDNLTKLAGRDAARKVLDFVAAADLDGINHFLTHDFPLDRYIGLNQHAVRQSHLIKLGGDSITVRYFYDLDSPGAMEDFSKRLDVRFPVSNQGSRTRHGVSPALRAKLETIYADDYGLLAGIFQRSSNP